MASTHSEAKTLRLRDGRTLGYVDCGDPSDYPVFHFHGHPGSRLEVELAVATVPQLGVRLIGTDRPGMGVSDFQYGRQLLDWPDDVVELADSLGLERFAVQGASGGGPYALACAFKIPDRVVDCGVVAGLGPIDRYGTTGMMPINRFQFAVARRLPWVLRPLFWTYLGRYRKYLVDEAALETLTRQLSKGVMKVTGDADLAQLYVLETLEAFRQGTRGPANDARLFAQPWGFRLEDIKVKVHLWHGGQDVHVPISMAKAVADSIHTCHTTFYPNEDHLRVILSHFGEVLAKMREEFE